MALGTLSIDDRPAVVALSPRGVGACPVPGPAMVFPDDMIDGGFRTVLMMVVSNFQNDARSLKNPRADEYHNDPISLRSL